jgi:hypothetical protein
MKEGKEIFGYWLLLLKHAKFESEVDFTKLSRPLCVCRRRVPTNLNGITFGQLCQLQELKNIGEMFVRVPVILLGATESEVLQARTTDVVRLSAWVAQELKRINEMWEKINRKPNSEEVRAGIDRIRHGMFGIADWYARRMGITDHEEVMQTSWIRVYQCMRMDNENARFAETLQKIYMNDRKTKRR